MQQIVQFIAQALQQGMQPEEIVKKLIEAGLPEDQAAQIVQAVIQQMQGALQNPGGPEPNGVQEYPQGPQEEMAEGPQGQEAPPQEAMEGQPPMRMGGTPCYNCGGMYANGGTYYQGNYFAQGGPFIPQYGDIAWNVDYATGGEAGMSNELVMQVAQLLQQGVQPEAILQQLVKAKIPQKKAVKIIQTVMQKLQGAQQAVDQQGIDQQQGAMMAYGGVPVVKTTTINPNYNVDVRTTINPYNLFGDRTSIQNIKLLPAKINMPSNYSAMEPNNLFGISNEEARRQFDNLIKMKMLNDTNINPKYSMDENGAVKLYSDAETIDGNGPYPPNDYGSSGLSIAKALKSAGLISSYQHTFTLNDALLALTTYPILVGINWYQEMFNPLQIGRAHV